MTFFCFFFCISRISPTSNSHNVLKYEAYDLVIHILFLVLENCYITEFGGYQSCGGGGSSFLRTYYVNDPY